MDGVQIFTKIMAENQEYFMDSSEIELKIENKKGYILDTYGLFEEDINMEVIFLKLIHNISMLHYYFIHYASQNDFDFINYKFEEDDNFYLRLSISGENINTDKRKGFGMFTYNVDDMVATIREFVPALKIYLQEEVEENNQLKELTRVINFIDIIKNGLEPNLAIITFIQENKDLYNSYISVEVEQ